MTYYDLVFLSQVGQTLVEQNEIAEIIPGIASSWEVSPDMRVYRFKIRQGITFHDGTPLELEDILYSLNRTVYSPANLSYYSLNVIEGYEEGLKLKRCPGIRGLPDDRVEIRLTRPYAPFLRILTSSGLAIQKKAAAEKTGTFMGTGPYRLVRQGEEFILEAFLGYVGPYPPKIKRVKLVSDTGVLTGQRKLSSSSIPDYVVGYREDQLGPLSPNDYRIVRKPGTSLSGFYLNHESPRLRSREERLRLIGVLQKVLRKVALPATGTLADDVYPLGMLGHQSGRPSYKALLKEAGAVRGALGTKELIVGVFSPVIGGNAEFARIFEEETGTRVTFRQLTHQDLLRQMNDLDADVFYLRWKSPFLDPETSLTPFGFLRAFEHAPRQARFNSLRREATGSVLNEERARKYGEIADLIFSEALYFPVFQWDDVQALRTNLVSSGAVYRYSPMLSEVDIKDGR